MLQLYKLTQIRRLFANIRLAGLLQHVVHTLLDRAQSLLEHFAALGRLRFNRVKLVPCRFQRVRLFQLVRLLAELFDVVLHVLVLVHFLFQVVDELRKEAGPLGGVVLLCEGRKQFRLELQT